MTVAMALVVQPAADDAVVAVEEVENLLLQLHLLQELVEQVVVAQVELELVIPHQLLEQQEQPILAAVVVLVILVVVILQDP